MTARSLKSRTWAIAASLALGAGAALAASAQAPADRSAIEELVVVGRYPGPPLWKVSSGNRTLYVFGELSPVPKGLEWDPRNAERVLDRAEAVIKSPRVSAATLNPIRLFRLFRAVRRLARTPKGTTLADQLPADLYARYAALRARHLGDDDDEVEIRPALAALRLYGAALDDVGLTTDTGIGKKVNRMMRRSRAEATRRVRAS